jgi:hypothetical protein
MGVDRPLKQKSTVAPLLLLTAAVAALGFNTRTLATVAEKQPGPRSYLELPGSGKLPIVPYVWEREARGRHIAVIGTRHNGDPRSPMYDRIEAIFKRVRPQLVLHESEAPADLATGSRDQAIVRGADLGFAVYLAGRYGAQVQSGDAPVKDEFKMLLARYPAGDVCVFLTAQRLIGSTRHPDLQAAAAGYPAFLQSYLVQNGIPKQPGWTTWDGFLHEYMRVVGSPLSSASWNPDLFSPTRNSGRLNEMARTSDTFRDQHLLAAIQLAMQQHDRVVVVFGGWHVLALEPELDGVLKN